MDLLVGASYLWACIFKLVLGMMVKKISPIAAFVYRCSKIFANFPFPFHIIINIRIVLFSNVAVKICKVIILKSRAWKTVGLMPRGKAKDLSWSRSQDSFWSRPGGTRRDMISVSLLLLTVCDLCWVSLLYWPSGYFSVKWNKWTISKFLPGQTFRDLSLKRTLWASGKKINSN